MKGTIKFYDSVKGYGFVEPEHPNQKDVYLPAEQVIGITLKSGDKVSFELEENERGYIAVDIKKVKNAKHNHSVRKFSQRQARAYC